MYRLNAEQTEIVLRARAIAEATLAPQAATVDEQGTFPQASVRALLDAGFGGLTIPATHGGLGQSLRVMAAVVDELAQQCASTAMVYMMHCCGVSCYLADPQKFQVLLRQCSRGEHLSTLAFSEKGSRSQFWAPVSQAVVDGQGQGRLSAHKSWVTSAGIADGMVASARSADGQGVSVFLVKKDDPGVRVAGGWNSLGMRGNQSNPVTMEQVALPAERLIGQDGAGGAIMLQSALPVFLVCQAAIGVGIAESAFRAARQHVMSAGFQHTGTRLMDLPNIRSNLAQMRLKIDEARAYLAAALDKLESAATDAMEHVLAVKVSSGEAAVQVGDLAMRTCGGAAFSKHLAVERAFRDSRAAIVMAPTTDHLREFVGRLLVGLPLFDPA